MNSKALRLFVVIAIAALLPLPGCRKSAPVPLPPAGQWVVGKIVIPPAPDGTAHQLNLLWKARKINFGAGRPYDPEAARQAQEVLRQYYRQNRIRKGQVSIRLKPLAPGTLELTFLLR
jgi:hypothetical protein